ncbi:MAG: type I DNA topoisomerase [bacterium]
MQLVIVESPTKAKTLAKFLGKEFRIEASMGHVRDLPEKGGGMAIDVEHDFKPQYDILSKKRSKVAELRAAAKNADVIYLAPDPDREGEAIAYHVAYLLQNNKKEEITDPRFRRVTFHEITETAIKESLKHPGTINMELVNAQQARRVLDRLVGYTLSPVLWRKVRRGLSAGRVQSVAVRLIVERELEIEAFIPVEYWQIFVDLTAKGGECVQVELVKKNKKTIAINNANEAKAVVADLETANYLISDVISEKQKSSPNPPFTTSLLQRAGSNLWGWSAKQTMSAAQSLYEHGFITYHRTDSYNLANEAVIAAREYLKNILGVEYVPDKPRIYKTKAASAQEAHEAIRPTDVNRVGSAVVGDKLSTNHQKLYELIRTRFLQCQMNDAIFDKTTLLVNTNPTNSGKAVYTLTASGKRIIFDGYLKLGKPTEETFLPALVAGEALSLVKVNHEQKFTKPSARFSEAGLIKELEKRGIGRPSTYAAIISTIQDRNYVVKEEKHFVPTSIGRAVIEYLLKYFGNVIAYEFTANMENDLDSVAEGKKEWVSVVKEFWEPFNKAVIAAEGGSERVKVPVESTGEKCPECKDGEIVIRTGKYGKFLSCSLFPECKYTKQYKEIVKDVVCPECGGEVMMRKSKKGAKFFGCGNYPTCKWAAWKLPMKKAQ